MLYTLLIIVEVVVSIALTLLILLQQGKGADAGAAFGSGASGTVFGARGSASFLSRTTAVLAFVFMANSTAMAWLSHQQPAQTSVVERAAGNAVEGAEHEPGGATGHPGPAKKAVPANPAPTSLVTPQPASHKPPAKPANPAGKPPR